MEYVEKSDKRISRPTWETLKVQANVKVIIKKTKQRKKSWKTELNKRKHHFAHRILIFANENIYVIIKNHFEEGRGLLASSD